jgi:signal peptidase II
MDKVFVVANGKDIMARRSKTERSFPSILLAMSLAIFVLISDQISKWLIIKYVTREDQFEIFPFFNIVRVENRGVTFGMLRQLLSPAALILISVVLVILLTVLTRKNVTHRLPVAAIVGGGIGNVVDRIMHGAVIDFLDFHVSKYHWPAFNIADSAIVLGVFAWFCISFVEGKKS